MEDLTFETSRDSDTVYQATGLDMEEPNFSMKDPPQELESTITSIKSSLEAVPWKRMEILWIFSQFVPAEEMESVNDVYSTLRIETWTDEQIERFRSHMNKDREHRDCIANGQCLICKVQTTNGISKCRHLMCTSCAAMYSKADCQEKVWRRAGTDHEAIPPPIDFNWSYAEEGSTCSNC